MKYEKIPEFETSEEADEWYNDKFWSEYDAHETLNSVDIAFSRFGLEVVLYEDNTDILFKIQKIGLVDYGNWNT